MKSLLIVTYSKIRTNNAGALRQVELANMFFKLGYDVTILGRDIDKDYCKELYDKSGIKVIDFKDILIDSSKATYFEYKKALKLVLSTNTFNTILVIDPPINSWLYLLKLKDIEIIHDSVEWYSSSQFKRGCLDPQYIIKNFTNRFLVNKKIKVISISSYLHNYYSSKNIKSVIIPITMEDKNVICTKEEQTLIYAGTPGRKDKLKELLLGLSLTKNKNINIKLFGVTNEDLSNILDINELDLANRVKCFGRSSREDVIDNLSKSTYSIFLRESSERYAKAGFPSKFVESLMCKTPVITNLSSDLSQYMIDGKNSVVVNSLNEQDIADAIDRAFEYDTNLLSKEAYNTYIKYFKYDKYVEELKEFLGE